MKKSTADLRVALVHDWLITMRGAEKCLEVLCEIFPEADIFTLFHKEGAVSDAIESHRIFTSFLQRFPSIETYYQNLLPLMPFAIEQFDFDGYDLVISSSWCCAKGVVVPFHVPHICYMYTPMRFSWDLTGMYADGGVLRKLFQPGLLHWIRMWEVAAAQRPDRIVSISHFVAKRVKKSFGIESEVVYPPVDVGTFLVGGDEMREEYYLMVTSFEPNKGVEIAVEAFNELKLPLKIVGSAGRLEKQIRRQAGTSVEFLGRVSDVELRELYAKTQALVHPAIEDFGIVVVEALASGTPVIGYTGGGTGEIVRSVKDGIGTETGQVPTGILFDDLTVDALEEAIVHFKKYSQNAGWDRKKMAMSMVDYSRENFKKAVMETVLTTRSRFKESSLNDTIT